jgi:hypothetical protein
MRAAPDSSGRCMHSPCDLLLSNQSLPISGESLGAATHFSQVDRFLPERRAQRLGLRTIHHVVTMVHAVRGSARRLGNPRLDAGSGTRVKLSPALPGCGQSRVVASGSTLGAPTDPYDEGMAGLLRMPTRRDPFQTSTAGQAEACKTASASNRASASLGQSQSLTATIWSPSSSK